MHVPLRQITPVPIGLAACAVAGGNGRIPPSIRHMFTRTRTGRVKRLASATLASLLLAGLLAALFPLETLATGQVCNLACCAGRAPHAAGSCMDGSCHAALNKRSTHHHSFQRSQVAEQLCGLSRIARRTSVQSNRKLDRSIQRSESQPARLSSITITKPCLPDCGSCAPGFVSSDFRNHAVIARRERARAHTPIRIPSACLALRLTLTALVRESPPRAPPITLS